MIRSLFVIGVMSLVCGACGDSSDAPNPGGSAGSGNAGGASNSGNAGGASNSGNAGSANNSSCPDVSGDWTLTDHCEASFIGMTLTVTEKDCALSFASPFDAFSGSVTTDGKIMLTGPQDCSGTATSTSVSMNCTSSTPGPCPVKLAR